LSSDNKDLVEVPGPLEEAGLIFVLAGWREMSPWTRL